MTKKSMILNNVDIPILKYHVAKDNHNIICDIVRNTDQYTASILKSLDLSLPSKIHIVEKDQKNDSGLSFHLKNAQIKDYACLTGNDETVAEIFKIIGRSEEMS